MQTALPPSRTAHSCLALALTAGIASAQMSGTYTVDPNGSGPRNFTDARAATFELTKNGVDGPVIVEFATAQYRYSCPIAPIPGASPTNTVTLKSKVRHGADFHSYTATSNVVPSGFLINGFSQTHPLRHLVIDGFTFSCAVLNNPPAVRSSSYANDIEVTNCKFDATMLEVTSSLQFKSRDWHVHHNQFAATAWNLELSLDGFDVHHNEFRFTTGKDPILLHGGRDPTRRGRFYNNLASGRLQPGRSSSAIDLVGHNIDIEHNTILVTAGGPTIRVQGKFGLWNEINNNVLVNLSSEPIVLLQDQVPYTYFLDGNLYWNPTTTLIFAEPNKPAFSLLTWQTASGQDSHSLFTDPLFDAVGLSLRNGTPAAQRAWMTKPYVTDDFAGKQRPTKATIGAYEGVPPPPPTTFKTFGLGCAGAGGKVPAIGQTGDLKLGSTNFAVTLANARGGVLVRGFLAIGASNTTWNTLPLPLALGGGCSLLVSPDILVNQTISGPTGPGNGSARVGLTIPNDPKLKGLELHFQWGVDDAAAKGIGIAFSNGGTLRI